SVNCPVYGRISPILSGCCVAGCCAGACSAGARTAVDRAATATTSDKARFIVSSRFLCGEFPDDPAGRPMLCLVLLPTPASHAQEGRGATTVRHLQERTRGADVNARRRVLSGIALMNRS